MQRRDGWLIAIGLGLICLAAEARGKDPQSEASRLSIHDRPPRKVIVGTTMTRWYSDFPGLEESEDRGTFWSNDPKATIGEMAGSLGLADSVTDEQVRAREAQDRRRGGTAR